MNSDRSPGALSVPGHYMRTSQPGKTITHHRRQTGLVKTRAISLIVFACWLAACTSNTEPQDISPIQTVLSDANGDAVPDRSGDVVTVAGHITRISNAPDTQSLFVQDETGSIDLRLRAPDSLLKTGDYLIAKGTVTVQDGRARLDVLSHQIDSLVKNALPPRPIPANAFDLKAYNGLFVRLKGKLVHRGTDERGLFFMVNRTGGPIVLRGLSSRDVESPRMVGLLRGSNIEVQGVLLESSVKDSALLPYEVHLRSAEDLVLLRSGFAISRWVYPLGILLMFLLIAWWIHSRRPFSRWSRSGVSDPRSACFDGTAIPVIIADAGLKIVSANKAAVQLLGSSYRKLRSTNLLVDWLHIDDKDKPADMPARLRQGETIHLEASLKQADSQDLLLSMFLNRFTVGEKSFLAVALVDQTSAREQERLFEDFHRALVDGIPIEVVVLTPQGEYVYVSPTVTSDANLRAWLLGKTDVDYCQHLGVHPEVALRRRALRKRAVTERNIISFEETIKHPSGEERHYQRVYNPVVNSDNEVYLVVSYGIETTGMRRFEAEARAASAEAHVARAEKAKIERLRSAFLDNINHEIRTPLSGIMGAAQIIRLEAPKSLHEFIEIIEKNGEKLTQTINSLLDLAGLRAEKIRMHPRVLNLVDEVSEVVKLLVPLARSKKLFLRIDAKRPEILACLDQDGVRRVLRNIIGNAVKFTEAGGVFVEVDGNAEEAVIRIIDTGIGISREYLPKIFDEFDQEDVGVTRGHEGAGIGLAITKRLLELMHGTITVDTEKDEGSMVTIQFPAGISNGDGTGNAGRQLLVIDSSSESRRLIRYMLEPFFHVEEAADLSAALERLRTESFDLVLMDSGHADHATLADGVDRLRHVSGSQSLPVLVMDSLQMPGSKKELLKLGFSGYVEKPLERRVLLDVLGDLLSERDREPVLVPGKS